MYIPLSTMGHRVFSFARQFFGGRRTMVGGSSGRVVRAPLQGVPKVRSHLAFADKTEYILLRRVYYLPMYFLFMARDFATRRGMPATRSRGIAGFMLAHADVRSAVSY